MGACLFISVGLLWYYKYLNFSIEMLNSLFSLHPPLQIVSGIVLPLGISFYTFHVLSYTLDVYFGPMPFYIRVIFDAYDTTTSN